jgi:hypothetical protein
VLFLLFPFAELMRIHLYQPVSAVILDSRVSCCDPSPTRGCNGSRNQDLCWFASFAYSFDNRTFTSNILTPSALIIFGDLFRPSEPETTSSLFQGSLHSISASVNASLSVASVAASTPWSWNSYVAMWYFPIFWSGTDVANFYLARYNASVLSPHRHHTAYVHPWIPTRAFLLRQTSLFAHYYAWILCFLGGLLCFVFFVWELGHDEDFSSQEVGVESVGSKTYCVTDAHEFQTPMLAPCRQLMRCMDPPPATAAPTTPTDREWLFPLIAPRRTLARGRLLWSVVWMFMFRFVCGTLHWMHIEWFLPPCSRGFQPTECSDGAPWGRWLIILFLEAQNALLLYRCHRYLCLRSWYGTGDNLQAAIVSVSLAGQSGRTRPEITRGEPLRLLLRANVCGPGPTGCRFEIGWSCTSYRYVPSTNQSSGPSIVIAPTVMWSSDQTDAGVQQWWQTTCATADKKKGFRILCSQVVLPAGLPLDMPPSRHYVAQTGESLPNYREINGKMVGFAAATSWSVTVRAVKSLPRWRWCGKIGNSRSERVCFNLHVL